MPNKHIETAEFIHGLAAAATFDLEAEIAVYKAAISALMEQTNEADMAIVNMNLLEWMESAEGELTVMPSHYEEYVNRLRAMTPQP